MNKCFLTSLTLLGMGGQIDASTQKNVLLIIVDDLRTELGCYGNLHIHTPNIDNFAKTATVFRNAFCNIPVSGASRASLLTGMYPQYPNRFISYDSYAQKDTPKAIPVSGWLKSQNYTTISNGKVFHNITDHDSSWSRYPWRKNIKGGGADWAVYNKWELWLSENSSKYVNDKSMRGPFCESADVADDAYEDGLLSKRTIEDLVELKKANKTFFLAAGFYKPHLPFNAPKQYWSMYDSTQIPLATNRYLPQNLPSQVKGSQEIKSYGLVENIESDTFHRLARHGYFAAVSYVDAQIGKVLKALDSLGLSQNTMVILIGDHGWNLGEHTFWGKHNLMMNATHVPMIVRVGGQKSAESWSLVEFVDIYPTICDYLNLPIPRNQLDGKTFLPILQNPTHQIKDYVRIIWENGVNIVNKQYSYTIWEDSTIYPQTGTEMLFDRYHDPQENNNVASKKQKIVREIKRKLNSYTSFNR